MINEREYWREASTSLFLCRKDIYGNQSKTVAGLIFIHKNIIRKK